VGRLLVVVVGDADAERPHAGLERDRVAVAGGLLARGRPYSFFVAPGTTNKLVVDFQGGGACWTKETCAVATALFAEKVDVGDMLSSGIYDRNDPTNPVGDAWHVLVPYCTGDVHWGDAVVDYGNDVVINHKGAVNARAVLDWVTKEFGGPDEILVTGCSAGAYGSVMWSPYVKRAFPKAKVTQLGDSGAGIITTTFFEQSFPRWNAKAAAPAFIPSLDPATNDWTKLALSDLYIRVGSFYPEMLMAQFNTTFDETQSYFYKAMGGGDAYEWSMKMKASVAAITAGLPSFRSYTGPGSQHCVIVNDDYKTFASNGSGGGTVFADWFRALLAGTATDVSCGTDCGKPK